MTCIAGLIFCAIKLLEPTRYAGFSEHIAAAVVIMLADLAGVREMRHVHILQCGWMILEECASQQQSWLPCWCEVCIVHIFAVQMLLEECASAVLVMLATLLV